MRPARSSFEVMHGPHESHEHAMCMKAQEKTFPEENPVARATILHACACLPSPLQRMEGESATPGISPLCFLRAQSNGFGLRPQGARRQNSGRGGCAMHSPSSAMSSETVVRPFFYKSGVDVQILAGQNGTETCGRGQIQCDATFEARPR